MDHRNVRISLYRYSALDLIFSVSKTMSLRTQSSPSSLLNINVKDVAGIANYWSDQRLMNPCKAHNAKLPVDT